MAFYWKDVLLQLVNARQGYSVAHVISLENVCPILDILYLDVMIPLHQLTVMIAYNDYRAYMEIRFKSFITIKCQTMSMLHQRPTYAAQVCLFIYVSYSISSSTSCLCTNHWIMLRMCYQEGWQLMHERII